MQDNELNRALLARLAPDESFELQPSPCMDQGGSMSAIDFLNEAASAIGDRASQRDTGSERSMARTVATFSALTGHQLSERDGWIFMVILKLSRAQGGQREIMDDYVDGAAYIALAGESVA